MKMTMSQIRDLTEKEIQDRLNEAKEELMKLRFQQSTGELTDHSQIRLTRRTIARLATILNQRQGAAVEGES
jgi:large subunit ribosomal protein L29